MWPELHRPTWIVSHATTSSYECARVLQELVNQVQDRSNAGIQVTAGTQARYDGRALRCITLRCVALHAYYSPMCGSAISDEVAGRSNTGQATSQARPGRDGSVSNPCDDG